MQSYSEALVSDLASWFAVETLPRREASVCCILNNKGYQPFLPQYKVRRRWSDRLKVVDRPLFPGYLFCRLGLRQRTLPLLTTPGVLQLVGVGKIPQPVPDHEIEAVQAIIRSGLPAQPWPFLKVGERVLITGGPLEGVEGTLAAARKHFQLVVSVEMLQRSVAVVIDSAFVRAARPRIDRIRP